MPDEDKTYADISRGQRAERLLEDDLFKEAWETLEAVYIEKLLTTQPMQTAEREKLYLAVNVARKVREHLGKIMANGRVAQRDLDMRLSRPR